MEEEIEAGKFIEYGEYKGNLYGTSLESVLALVNAGCVCIISPHYQVSLTSLKYRHPRLTKFIFIYINYSFSGNKNDSNTSDKALYNLYKTTFIR
jgi:guanylate kinase